MGLEFLHLSERRNHPEIENRALARGQRAVAPGLAPAVLGHDALKIAVEFIDIGKRAVDIILAKHLAAHCESAIVGWLVHGLSDRYIAQYWASKVSTARCANGRAQIVS